MTDYNDVDVFVWTTDGRVFKVPMSIRCWVSDMVTHARYLVYYYHKVRLELSDIALVGRVIG